MKGFSLACAAACTLALVSGGAEAASLIGVVTPHVGPVHRSPAPCGPQSGGRPWASPRYGSNYSGWSRYSFNNGASWSLNNGSGWRLNGPYGQNGYNSWNSGSGLGSSGGVYFPQAQPTPDAAYAAPAALIVNISSSTGGGSAETSAEPGAGPRIIYINRDPAGKAATSGGPKVIYGEVPAHAGNGPRIIYGDTPN
jgi:hypothetical protein